MLRLLLPAGYITSHSANQPFDIKRRHFFKNPDWACADDLIVLTEGKVNAASVNLFHALLVSIKHTLSCHIQTAGNDYDRVLLLNSVRKNSIKKLSCKILLPG